MTQQTVQTAPANTHFPVLTRVLFLVAAILFVISSLFAGGVISGYWLPWALGGLAAIALAWAVA